MRTTFRPIIAALLVLSLVACQQPSTVPPAVNPAPTTSQITEFFEGLEGRWISVEPPVGWVAKLGGTDQTPLIVVTDDWERYQNKNNDAEAIGIIIVPLGDQGSAEEVLAVAVRRLEAVLAEQTGAVVVEPGGGQEYAWAEYGGKAMLAETPMHYLLAAIATDARSALVFTLVTREQRESVRPYFHTVVKAVRLH